jgi:nucleoside-diphosphate-sugar epimerase
MKKILVIGGAGYIGTILINFLLSKNYNVVSYDNFIYEHQKTSKKTKDSRFKSVKKNICRKLKKNDFKNYDAVIVLAGLVGDPITKKYKSLSKLVNIKGIKNIINICKNIDLRFIFVSTCSNYGFLKGKIANEKTKLNPISNYAKQKVEIEKYILSIKKNSKFKPVILRFSTAFGSSLRPRFDLTINEFVLRAYLKQTLEVYDHETWRPYCHLIDFSNIIYKCLIYKKNNINYQVFNVGSNHNNYRKIDIVKKIKKFIPNFKYKIVKNSVDPRDYRVSFNKLKKFFKIKKLTSVDFGIREILIFLKKEKNVKKFLNYGNYKIINK